MVTYTPTAADRLPLPASWSTEPRYLGYREDDYRKPYAKYFKTDTLPVQDHVREALLAGMAPTEWGYDLTTPRACLSGLATIRWRPAGPGWRTAPRSSAC